MSTEEDRRRNREKQRRFLLRHPNYRKEQLKKKGIIPGSTGQYRTFELIDPRDPDQLPRLIGCGSDKKPWASLWVVRHYSRAPWATWFQELELAGLDPEEYASPWDVGKPARVTFAIAFAAVHRRIAQISLCATGGVPPAWLLRHTLKAVAYVRDGQVRRFQSVYEAAKRVHKRGGYLHNLILLAHTDPQGRTWFDD